MLRKISAEELERIISERKEGEPLDLSGCLFEDLDLSGWDLRQINFDKSDFRNVRLNGADLSGCSASNAFFQGSSLRGTILQDAFLHSADFRYCDMTVLIYPVRISLRRRFMERCLAE